MTAPPAAPVTLRKQTKWVWMMNGLPLRSPLLLLLLGLSYVFGGCATPPAPTQRSRADADLRLIAHALTRYHHSIGRWPENGEGLAALEAQIDPATQRPFLSAPPRDPWGNRYQYRFNPAQGHLTIWSFGVDIVSSADDIRNELRITK
ncbi:MAG TPA: type II secretion system protein GspG [Chthoniobacteraceae bacterium]|nr:type II secretion system protein GspG [Chthoniobacteraceae bacterium]